MKTEYLLYIILGLALVGWIILIHLDLNSDKDSLNNTGSFEAYNLTSQLAGVIFNADYLEFTDGNLTMRFDSYFLFDLDSVDFMTFNVANKSYTYKKEY